jgi:hypothetical protein
MSIKTFPTFINNSGSSYSARMTELQNDYAYLIQLQSNKSSQIEAKKQEFLGKSKEIQKESVKIVANKVKKSADNLEIKKTITELIQEIDACIALLNEE